MGKAAYKTMLISYFQKSFPLHMSMAGTRLVMERQKDNKRTGFLLP